MKPVAITAGALLLAVFAHGLGARLAVAAEPDGVANLREVAAEDDLLGRMIGQLIMVGFHGDSEHVPGVIAVCDQLAKGEIGGVVLYPENIRSPRQLRLLTAYLADANTRLVPFIAVDQEGGMVERLTRRKGFNRFPPARKVGSDPKLSAGDGALRLYERMARELASVGINVNFGPVLDLSVNAGNPVVVRRKRSFGRDPGSVAKLGGAFIEAHRAANVIPVAKHFPGHGSSWTDSHKVLPDISRGWSHVELEPYVDLSRDGLLDMVMIGHLYHPRFSDGDRLPASLSAKAVDALRAKGAISFRGVIVSDDLEMGAVRFDFSLEERVVMAVNAGIDLLVFSNVKSRDPELGVKIQGIIADAVRDGRIKRERIEEAYGKILLLKRRLMQHDLAGKW